MTAPHDSSRGATFLPTPDTNGMGLGKSIGLIVLIVGLWVAGILVGYALGARDGEAKAKHDTTEGATSMVINAAIVKIDEGANLTQYGDYVEGDRVNIKLLATVVAQLLENTENTLCSPDGLSISAIFPRDLGPEGKCGPSIHVTLIPPL